MQSSNSPLISTYQRAILTEMGISCWQSINEKNVENAQDETLPDNLEKANASAPEVISAQVSPEQALAKLNALKTQTQQLPSTEAVLTSFCEKDASSPLFTDVLLALDISPQNVLHIESGQQGEYTQYPLAWMTGSDISFEQRQLITPSLASLITNPDLKKQLWQQLQTSKT